MGMFDHGTLSGQGGETPLHLSQLIQVAVFGLCLQLAMRGTAGPMGLTGRSGPVVSFKDLMTSPNQKKSHPISL